MNPRQSQILGVVIGGVFGVYLGWGTEAFITNFIFALFLGTALGYYVSLGQKGSINVDYLSPLEALRKFPYKYMLAIISIIGNSENPVTLRQIRKVSGACAPDARETMNFLSFLTSRGKIIHSSRGWVKIPPSPQMIPLTPPKRSWLIVPVLQIVDSLVDSPKALSELHQIHNLKTEDLEEYLIFLSKISAKGIIRGKISLPGTFAQTGKWYASPN